MPGVPSFKGCDACRKQKKKCDQNQPACSRCARLQIPCIGVGQQRYRFKVQTPKSAEPRVGSSQLVQASEAVVPSRSLSNPTTRSAGSFVSALGVTDIRYELSIYGEFLQDIPRRLGTNAALDASVTALTTAFETVQNTQHQPAKVFGTYAKALSSLRTSLNNPDEARSPETLCAIWFIVVCQGWIGRHDDDHASHGEAMSFLLSAVIVRGCTSPFETQLARTLSVVVILESFFNHRIILDPRLWDIIDNKGSPKPDAPYRSQSLSLRNLARIAHLFRNPQSSLDEIQTTYESIRDDCIKMDAILSKTPTTRSEEGMLISDLPESSRRLHVRQQTCHGVLLMIALAMSAILKSHQAEGTDSQALEEEADVLVDQAINLAGQAMQYRPLASSNTPSCLITAWAVTDDSEKKRMLEKLLDEYQADFASVRWQQQAIRVRAWLRGPTLSGSSAREHISLVIT